MQTMQTPQQRDAAQLAILKKLFPSPAATFNGRSGFEVNGLAKDTIPQNCKILDSGLATTNMLGRQEHYLVSVDDALVRLRVCTAMDGSGYAEFAVIHAIAFTDEDKQDVIKRTKEFIQYCCHPHPRD